MYRKLNIFEHIIIKIFLELLYRNVSLYLYYLKILYFNGNNKNNKIYSRYMKLLYYTYLLLYDFKIVLFKKRIGIYFMSIKKVQN